MGDVYEIHADEAWTHDGEHSGRYWCFFGGVFGKASDIESLQTRLRLVRERHGLRLAKVNWKYLNAANAEAFQAFADEFFAEFQIRDLKYRQLFLDRAYVHLNHEGDPSPDDRLEGQFKIYYQFLKHAFCLTLLPRASPDDPTIIRVKLDEHSSQHHKQQLIDFASSLPSVWRRPDLRVEIGFIRAKRSQVMQLCDLLCGAAGSHGNRLSARRAPGQRGMTGKQKVRHSFATHLYGALREFDAKQRGTKAFNWFESTGSDGDPNNRYHHKLRIWKFEPRRFVLDRGWFNDHLDSQGRYVEPDFGVPRETTQEVPDSF